MLNHPASLQGKISLISIPSFPCCWFLHLCSRNRFISTILNKKSIVIQLYPEILVVHWLDSDLIPRLLENFEKWENFMAILLSIKNNSYRRILSAQACSGTEISPYAILKLQSGATTLKNHFSSKIFLAFQRIFRVTGTVRFSSENIRVFQSNRKNSIFRTSAILESVINNHPIYGYISNLSTLSRGFVFAQA